MERHHFGLSQLPSLNAGDHSSHHPSNSPQRILIDSTKSYLLPVPITSFPSLQPHPYHYHKPHNLLSSPRTVQTQHIPYMVPAAMTLSRQELSNPATESFVSQGELARTSSHLRGPTNESHQCHDSSAAYPRTLGQPFLPSQTMPLMTSTHPSPHSWSAALPYGSYGHDRHLSRHTEKMLDAAHQPSSSTTSDYSIVNSSLAVPFDNNCCSIDSSAYNYLPGYSTQDSSPDVQPGTNRRSTAICANNDMLGYSTQDSSPAVQFGTDHYTGVTSTDNYLPGYSIQHSSPVAQFDTNQYSTTGTADNYLPDYSLEESTGTVQYGNDHPSTVQDTQASVIWPQHKYPHYGPPKLIPLTHKSIYDTQPESASVIRHTNTLSPPPRPLQDYSVGENVTELNVRSNVPSEATENTQSQPNITVFHDVSSGEKSNLNPNDGGKQPVFSPSPSDDLEAEGKINDHSDKLLLRSDSSKSADNPGRAIDIGKEKSDAVKRDCCSEGELKRAYKVLEVWEKKASDGETVETLAELLQQVDGSDLADEMSFVCSLHFKPTIFKPGIENLNMRGSVPFESKEAFTNKRKSQDENSRNEVKKHDCELGIVHTLNSTDPEGIDAHELHDPAEMLLSLKDLPFKATESNIVDTLNENDNVDPADINVPEMRDVVDAMLSLRDFPLHDVNSHNPVPSVETVSSNELNDAVDSLILLGKAANMIDSIPHTIANECELLKSCVNSPESRQKLPIEKTYSDKITTQSTNSVPSRCESPVKEFYFGQTQSNNRVLNEAYMTEMCSDSQEVGFLAGGSPSNSVEYCAISTTKAKGSRGNTKSPSRLRVSLRIKNKQTPSPQSVVKTLKAKLPKKTIRINRVKSKVNKKHSATIKKTPLLDDELANKFKIIKDEAIKGVHPAVFLLDQIRAYDMKTLPTGKQQYLNS